MFLLTFGDEKELKIQEENTFLFNNNIETTYAFSLFGFFPSMNFESVDKMSRNTAQ